MVQEFFGKVRSITRNARVVKTHAPKLWAAIAITLITSTGIIGSTLKPLETDAKAMNAKDSRAVVVCAYKGFLNRSPDRAGLSYWMERYSSREKLNYNATKLGASFYGSKEGQKYENLIGFDKFLQRTYLSCLKRNATSNEVKIWSNKHLTGMSRAEIFGFIVAAGDKPWTFPAPCKAYNRGGTVTPLCAYGTKGTQYNVSVVNVTGSNIRVNAAWASTITNFRNAALKKGYNLQAYKDPSNLPNCIADKVNFNNSYRSMADQDCLYRTLPKGQANPAGRSMHEWGLAIDFSCNRTNKPTNTAASIKKDVDCWTWVKNNAPRYGIYMHYSASGIGSREAHHFSPNRY